MPQRFLRPGITTSDPWNACGWKAQSLYIRLITLVDDYGRYDGRTAIIHGSCFALRDDVKPQETAALVVELCQNGLILIYQSGGKDYLQILKWQERARGESRYPDPKNADPLRNPAESCGILPPESSPLAISHKPIATPAEALAEVEIPDVLKTDDFIKKWEEWKAYRKKLKKSKDWNHMWKLQLADLAEFGSVAAIHALKVAMRSGWTSFHEPRVNFSKKTKVEGEPITQPGGFWQK